MSVREETERDMAGLPADAVALTSAHWRLMATIDGRLVDELRELQPLLKRYETVSERSAQSERQAYAAVIARAHDLLTAVGIYEDWWHAAKVDALDPRAAHARRNAHEGWTILGTSLNRIGDPSPRDRQKSRMPSSA